MPLLGVSKDRTWRGTRAQLTRPQYVLQKAWYVSRVAILPGAQNGVRSCWDGRRGQQARQSPAAARAQHIIRPHSPQRYGQFFPAPATHDWKFAWTNQDRAMDSHRVLPAHFCGDTRAGSSTELDVSIAPSRM